MASPDRFLLTDHASVALRERDISVEWARRVLARPRLRLPDAEDPGLLHALAPIAEREDRVLRVAYNGATDPWRVVTACSDRAWRGML
ncbi:MAG: hypothetical protein OHK0028_17160 [Deltaproteobacteria bacterium]